MLTVESNCQWYYEKYGVKDLSQLTKGQLNQRLKLDKNLLFLDAGFFIVGTTFIIVGTHLINEANSESLTVPGVHDYVNEKLFGVVFKTSGIVVDIGALILIPLCLKEMNQIKKVLGNTEVKLGLFKYCPSNMLNNSDGLLIPEILFTVRF